MLTFRDANIEDAEWIYELKKDAFRAMVEPLWGWDDVVECEKFHRFFRPGDIRIVLFEGESVGFLECREEDGFVVLANIVLLPKFRGRGFGTELVRGVQQNAVRSQKKVRLRTLVNHHLAVGFYTRLGFRIADESETHLTMIYSGI